MAEAVLFDLDGTLIDSEPVWAAANTALVRSRRAEVTDELLRGLSGLDATLAMRRIHRHYGWTGLDVHADVAFVQRRVRESYSRGVHWLPGAHALLTGVRAAGLRVALVTSTYRGLVRYVLSETGPGAFDAVVCGDDGHRPKPDPAPYLAAMDALGVGPADCVALEDSAVGVASAHVAGCAVLNVAPVMRSDLAHTWAPSLLHVDVAELRAAVSGRDRLRPEPIGRDSLGDRAGRLPWLLAPDRTPRWGVATAGA